MTQKFHINASGDALPCRASVRPCIFGGESGTDNHFESAESARSFVEASMADNLLSTYSKETLIPGEVTLSSNLGTFEVPNGDLSNPNARLALSSGLCGGLALAIHDISKADLYFVTYSATETEEFFKEKFLKDPNTVFEAAHVMTKSLTNPASFVDSYGQKSLEDVEELYSGGTVIKGNRDMAVHFSGTDHENLSEFALAAIELDKNSESYPYEDFVIDDGSWPDEDDWDEDD